jgi:hypothetical protein
MPKRRRRLGNEALFYTLSCHVANGKKWFLFMLLFLFNFYFYFYYYYILYIITHFNK